MQWLRRTLAQADGIHGDVGDDSPVDDVLSARIKNFQLRRGLNADGVVGPETLIHLGAMDKDRQIPTLSAVGGVAWTGTGQAVTRLSRLTSR